MKASQRRVVDWVLRGLFASAVATVAACSDSSLDALGSVASDGGFDAAFTTTAGDAGPHVFFTIGGTVTGLAGKGLTLTNNGESLPIAADGSFAFPSSVLAGDGYDVKVTSAPYSPTQVCTVANGSGTATATVTGIVVTCTTSAFAVGGTITGLAGSGLVLSDNGGDEISPTADATFSFPTNVASGNAFSVKVKTNPSTPTQVCSVVGGEGTVGSGAVSSVVVNCSTNAYTVGGTINGLKGTAKLRINDGDEVTVTQASGTFAFPTAIASNTPYTISVSQQPGQPVQLCTVSQNASGKITNANVSSAVIDCTTTKFKVGVAVTGLAGTGLVFQDNGKDSLSVTKDGTYYFGTTIESGAAYAVAVLTRPSSRTQTCVVDPKTAAGNVTNADVVPAVTCTTNTYAVGGTVTGLAANANMVLSNNGENLTVTGDKFTFTKPVASGDKFDVEVQTQPGAPAQTCSVGGNTGTIGGADVDTVVVNCETNKYLVTGTVTGLKGSVVLQDNGADDLTLNALADGSKFAFATSIPSGTGYEVSVKSDPTKPAQTCSLSKTAKGTIGAGDVTDVALTCTTNKYAIKGTVTGLAANESVVLQNDKGDDLTVNGGSFTFGSTIESGASYDVSVLGNPATPITQTCTVGRGSGTVGGSEIADVAITCTTNEYDVGGTVANLKGSGLQITNGGETTAITAGTFTLKSQVASGATYTASITAQPSLPSQTCAITKGTDIGTVTNAAVSSIAIVCTTNTYDLDVAVTGLAQGASVTVTNGADSQTITADTTSTKLSTLASGSSYEVKATPGGTVSQKCTVGAPIGVIGGGNTTVAINCATNAFMVGGTLTGLNGTVVLANSATGETLSLNASNDFTFTKPVPSGTDYTISVKTNPSSPVLQTCSATNDKGTVGSADITNVKVACVTNTYTVGGTVSGLVGTVVLQNNSGDDLSVSAKGTFTFTTKVPSGGSYSVSVKTQPAAKKCLVTKASGAVTNAAITTVVVSCTDVGWYFPNYSGAGPWVFSSSTLYNGTISCETTCAFYGLAPTGARFVCNSNGATTEGCSPANDGQYGTSNCGALVDNGVLTTANGNNEDCASYSGTPISTCWQVGSSCRDPVGYHALQCQCK